MADYARGFWRLSLVASAILSTTAAAFFAHVAWREHNAIRELNEIRAERSVYKLPNGREVALAKTLSTEERDAAIARELSCRRDCASQPPGTYKSDPIADTSWIVFVAGLPVVTIVGLVPIAMYFVLRWVVRGFSHSGSPDAS